MRLAAAFLLLLAFAAASHAAAPRAPAKQSIMDARAKSAGCLGCHTATDRPTMHQNPGVVLGCTDCHGGDASIDVHGAKRGTPEYTARLREAHVLPRDLAAWNWPS
ncbi:MAG TPA: hypothetical protein VI139_08470, partial [Gemmatimonadales bacterium]